MLRLLGTASIEASSGPVTGRAAQGRRFALLALLALARGRAATRDKLIALLWPESPPDRARAQLSDAVHWLERAYAARNPGLIYLRSEPALENLRSHPRVARILSEMKLPAR